MKKRNLNSRKLRLMSAGLLASSAVLSVADSAPVVAKEKDIQDTQDTQGQDEQEAVTILSSTAEETDVSKETMTSETIESSTSSEESTSTTENSTEETTDSSTADTNTTSTTDTSTSDSSQTESSTSTSSSSSSSSSTSSSSASSSSSSTSISKPKPAKPKPKPVKPTQPPTWIGSVNNNVQGPVQPATPNYPVTGNVVQGVGNGSTETISFSPNLTTKAFINVIGEDAREIAGSNNLYASVMIAQAILESASGNSTLASAPNYNLFGIKGDYKGASANFLTSEDNGSGSIYTIRSDFRKYPSYKESLEDYVKLLRGGTDFNNNFYSGTWKSNTKSHKDATSFLTGKYATDTSYAGKLNGLIEAYDLTQYDELKDTSSDKKTEKNKTVSSLDNKVTKKDEKQEKNIEFVTHIVKKGESLKSISELYNISTLAILEKNQLDRRMLFIGQTLKIPKQEITTDEIRKEDVVDRSFEMAQKISMAFSGRTSSTESSNKTKESKILESSTISSSVASESSLESSSTINSTTASSSTTSSSVIESSSTESSSTTTTSSTDKDTTKSTSSRERTNSSEQETADSSSDYKISATRTKTKNTYEVKEGDTLASISKKTGVSIWSLKEWNDLDQYFLTEGQLLVLNPVYKLDA